ncbi:hypothetical protein FPOAC2_05018 [Fusarium poae]|jgi:hypothetical protein
MYLLRVQVHNYVLTQIMTRLSFEVTSEHYSSATLIRFLPLKTKRFTRIELQSHARTCGRQPQPAKACSVIRMAEQIKIFFVLFSVAIPTREKFWQEILLSANYHLTGVRSFVIRV